MSRNFMDSKSVKEVLEGLVEQKVTIVLISGQRLTVEVDAVIDGLLVASVCGKILFISIECICVVITCCEEVLESLLNKKHSPKKIEGNRCIPKGKVSFDDSSRAHEEESEDFREFDF